MVYYFERPCRFKYRKCIDYNIKCDDCWNNILRKKIDERYNKSEQKKGVSYYDCIGWHYL